MSVPVPLDQVRAAVAARSLSYLVAVGPDGPRVLQVRPEWHDGDCLVEVGVGTARAIAAHRQVVLVCPPTHDDHDQYTLLVDAVAEVRSDGLCAVHPVSAVLHRRQWA